MQLQSFLCNGISAIAEADETLAASNGGTTTSKTPSKIKLVDYSDAGAKFSMKVPSGWKQADGSNKTDTSVVLFAPSDDTIASGSEIDVDYYRDTKSTKGTTEAEYFANVTKTAHEDADATHKIASESKVTVGGHPAYKIVLNDTTTYGSAPAQNSLKTTYYIYIDSFSEYQLTFRGDSAYADLASNIDGMLSSFKAQP